MTTLRWMGRSWGVHPRDRRSARQLRHALRAAVAGGCPLPPLPPPPPPPDAGIAPAWILVMAVFEIMIGYLALTHRAH